VLSAPYPFHTTCVFGGTKLASFDVPSTAGKPSLPVLGVSSANLNTLLRDAHRAEKGVRDFLGVGYQSFTNFRKATWLRKILWLGLVATSLPIRLLYNSVVSAAEPSYGAYEIIVSEKSFEGKPFNVSALNATQFRDQGGAPVPFLTRFPSQWPGVPQLRETCKRFGRTRRCGRISPILTAGTDTERGSIRTFEPFYW
jgi:hypothetical protein